MMKPLAKADDLLQSESKTSYMGYLLPTLILLQEKLRARQHTVITGGNVLSLINLVLTIPATSVKAERGFSVMKRVKTDFRIKLANPALNDLLRIILLSPAEVGFDPLPAIQHWHAALQRRQPRERPAPQTQEQDEHSLPSLTDLLQDASAKNPPGTYWHH